MSVTFSNIQAGVVLVASTLGALTGLANLIWALRERSPDVSLHAGPKEFSIDQSADLYLINHGKMSVRLRDYGLILFDGTLFSFPVEAEVGDVSIYRNGPVLVEPGCDFQAGAEINGRCAGVYCRLYDDRRLRFAFYGSVGLRERFRLRAKIARI